MTNFKSTLKQVVITGGALFVAIAAPIEASRYMGYDIDVISVASAAESGHSGQAGAKGAGGKTGSKQGGASGGSQGSGSGKAGKSLEKSVLTPSVDEDSDRPVWAGVKGGKAGAGGKPGTAGSKKGDLYGDLFVLVRDPVTGAALLDASGLPLVQAYDVNGVLLPGISVPRDAEGNLVLTGTLPNGTPYTYTTKEVEFGRLSVGRAPTKVLDHSLVEAVTKLVAADASATDTMYITQDAAGRLVIVTDGVAKAIDSPLENLALFKAIANLPDGVRTISITTTSKDGGLPVTLTWTIPTTINVDLLKASLLASAADKTGTLTLDTVMYMLPIIGVTDNLSSVSYDRKTTYESVMTTVLVTSDGGVTWTAKEVSVYDAVFNKTNVEVPAGATDFAQAADDALQVIEFIHEYAVPVLPK